MKFALVIVMLGTLTACALPATPSQLPLPTPTVHGIAQTPTRDLCADVDRWASDVSLYDVAVGETCSGHPSVPVDEATKCRQTALAAWDSLTNISPPLIATTSHDILRRAMIYQVQASDVYIAGIPGTSGQHFYNESVDMRREFRECRDLILALCGRDQSRILADVEWRHTVEDIRQRQMLTDDPAEYERLGLELRRIRDARIARPESERQRAVELVKSIVGQDAVVEYLYTSYSRESYAVGRTWFEIERTTDILVRINELPRTSPTDPMRELDLTPRYTSEELERMAQGFIYTYAPEVDLEALTPDHHFDESSHYYWFRWNLPATKNYFVQIAYTPAAEIVAYTNALLGY